jgi:ABC-type branched-subunit amino acid transport system substrate-binding protein
LKSVLGLCLFSGLQTGTTFPAFGQGTPGVSENEVWIGSCSALEGPSHFLGVETVTGAKAYCNLVNEESGVNGRKLRLISADLGKHFPAARPNFVSLEGFVDAMVLVEGLKRAGKDLTREGLIHAIESIHDHALGLGPQLKLTTGRQLCRNNSGDYLVGLCLPP